MCSVLSDSDFQIKFTIAECREPCVPDGELDLELRLNDRVVVIEGRSERNFNVSIDRVFVLQNWTHVWL